MYSQCLLVECGAGFGSGMMGKPGRAWVSAWVVHGCLVVGGLINSGTTIIADAKSDLINSSRNTPQAGIEPGLR